MNPRGLKFNIVIHLSFLIAMAMLLVDLVLVTAANNFLTNSLVNKGDILLSTARVSLSAGHGRRELNDVLIHQMPAVSRDAGVACLLVVDKSRESLFLSHARFPEFDRLKSIVHASLENNKKSIEFFGRTWGVFWEKSEYLAIVSPLRDGPRVIGAAGVVFHLENQYRALRHFQKLLIPYMAINLMVLVFIGVYLISKVTVNPVKRILKRAETFREDEDIFFRDDIKSNEFSRLSLALNRMLRRITKDRDRLKSTVASLENANAELKQAQQEVIRCEKAASVGRLASGIAHEIGNPLGIILGYLDLLRQEGLTEEERRDFINRLEKEIRRINTVIRQLLDFSRPGMGKSDTVSVHHLISGLVDMAAMLPMMRSIELAFSNDASRDIILSDADALKQVLLNLLINAADAVSSIHRTGGGKISITTQNFDAPNGEWIAVAFRDNGPGIASEDLANIFDPFFTTKEPGKGTGLGLWVSHMMVENMGGQIEASTGVECGAELTIKLPLS